MRRLFSDDYLVSPGKTEVTMRTAARENALLAGVTADCCGLYVSIPFCPTRCAYCSFVSYSNKKLFALIPDYLEKLLADIRDTAGTDRFARPAAIRHLHRRRHTVHSRQCADRTPFRRPRRLCRTVRCVRIYL